MQKDTIEKTTGRRTDEWFDTIAEAGLGESSHKAIADYLHEKEGVSYWWAQTITVEYEKHIGRRIEGQTADGSFQIGVSKTINATVQDVWDYLESASGIELLSEAGGGGMTLAALDTTGPSGIRLKTTTYHEGSHARMQWQAPDWKEHSILQVRVSGKPKGKSLLTFHQEKLPSIEAREAMKTRWRDAANAVANAVGNAPAKAVSEEAG